MKRAADALIQAIRKEIAVQLKLSVRAIETYKARSMEKLRLRSRVGIAREAQLVDWLRDEAPTRGRSDSGNPANPLYVPLCRAAVAAPC